MHPPETGVVSSPKWWVCVQLPWWTGPSRGPARTRPPRRLGGAGRARRTRRRSSGGSPAEGRSGTGRKPGVAVPACVVVVVRGTVVVVVGAAGGAGPVAGGSASKPAKAPKPSSTGPSHVNAERDSENTKNWVRCSGQASPHWFSPCSQGRRVRPTRAKSPALVKLRVRPAVVGPGEGEEVGGLPGAEIVAHEDRSVPPPLGEHQGGAVGAEGRTALAPSPSSSGKPLPSSFTRARCSGVPYGSSANVPQLPAGRVADGRLLAAFRRAADAGSDVLPLPEVAALGDVQLPLVGVPGSGHHGSGVDR